MVDPYIGTRIGDDIEILALAGRGGMGRVYRARQERLDRDVAVKILHRELSCNPELVQRFHREAKIVCKLQHPHVVEVFFVGQLPDGALYIVMEYLDGLSLASALAQAGGTMPIDRALSIMVQICDAVGEGHARGIVHRDLKPENVMLVRRGDRTDWVKVLDFGIAKMNIDDRSIETAAGHVFGTGRYISPEGAEANPVGPQGDVYALATIVYQMLAGRTPFDADHPVALFIKQIHAEPPPLHSWPSAQGVPASIAKIVMDNLAKDPAERAPDAREFACALASAARDANITLNDSFVGARLGQFAKQERSSPRPMTDVTLEPTIDSRNFVGEGTRPLPTVVYAPLSSGAPTSTRTSAARALRSKRWRGLAVIVTLAFLLGAAVAVIGIQKYRSHDGDRIHLIAQARRALAESRYVSPPGDNVRDLVSSGLARWPDDIDFVRVRSSALREMVTRAMAARSAGDVGGALILVKAAAELDTTDRSARILIGQYENDLRSLETSGTTIDGPKVLFDIPALGRPSSPVNVRLHVIATAPDPTLTDMTLTVFNRGTTSNGTAVPLQPIDKMNFKGSFSAPAVGSYDVVFTANVEGRAVRAERDLDVLH